MIHFGLLRESLLDLLLVPLDHMSSHRQRIGTNRMLPPSQKPTSHHHMN
jgi:hypothetical protein